MWVILKDAAILLLDEVSSALVIKLKYQHTLYNMLQGKTVIEIAHRLSTIARMDLIIVTEKGSMV